MISSPVSLLRLSIDKLPYAQRTGARISRTASFNDDRLNLDPASTESANMNFAILLAHQGRPEDAYGAAFKEQEGA
jgi:hypothetical protein